MGMFKTPKPAPNPELEKQKADQAKINKQESERQAFDDSERKRKIAGNLYGSKSLQDEYMQCFGGHRTLITSKKMGNYNA